MKLKDVLIEILSEQDGDVLEFPDENLTISIDRPKRRLIFAPQKDASLPSKLRTILTMVRQEFKVSKVTSLEDEGDAGPGDTDDPKLQGVFELVLDPRENIDKVVDFIKTAADEE